MSRAARPYRIYYSRQWSSASRTWRKKKLPEVGDIHITGIVNLSGGVDTVILQTTRLATIMTLADAIASGLSKAIHSVTCQASCPLL
ncbi:MAG: DUF1256 domain-containing protein [[Bacteroides] pectinophilus]|nr:DUF1256 domain-containing protein [[Bacteroides] pectinophilus]